MCERTLSDQDSGEDCQSHAAKMLEIFVLQCGQDGRIDHLLPNIVQLILNRLQSTFEDADFSGLRTELLCVSFTRLNKLISVLHKSGLNCCILHKSTTSCFTAAATCTVFFINKVPNYT